MIPSPTWAEPSNEVPLALKAAFSSNSCGETRPFTTSLSSIVSGFEWIKGKVKQWKAIKRFL